MKKDNEPKDSILNIRLSVRMHALLRKFAKKKGMAQATLARHWIEINLIEENFKDMKEKNKD